jgi:hypothetical protein
LVVAWLQLLVLLAGFLFLKETHPSRTEYKDFGLRMGEVALKWRSHFSSFVGYRYSRLEEAPDNQYTVDEVELSQLGHTDKNSSTDDPDVEIPKEAKFTRQVILQILSVSLLAFHKVSSDAVMPVFLAGSANTTHTADSASDAKGHSSPGFGYSTQTIGLILLSQAIVGIAVQIKVIPYLISRHGALTSYRAILSLYPILYLFTPFLPFLPTPLPLITVVLELWSKVVLSAAGYICSAIL